MKHKRPIRYILSGHTPVPATPLEWMTWFGEADTCVALTEIAPGHSVSTEFIGDGYNMFETAILTDTTLPGERCNVAARYQTTVRSGLGASRHNSFAPGRRSSA